MNSAKERAVEAGARANPGSPEAVNQGCTCPVLDNGHGRGYMGGAKDREGNVMFVYSAACPIHGARIQQMAEAL